MYLEVAVIRHSSDTLQYEDSEGKTKSVSVKHLGDAIATATPLVAPRPKLDIPVPKINNVPDYERQIKDDFQTPLSYVRYEPTLPADRDRTIEYVVDEEDELWLKQNAKFGGQRLVTAGDDETSKKPAQLSLPIFEQMIDLMEKQTAFDMIITATAAETLFQKRIPILFRIFPLKSGNDDRPSVREVVHDVHNYWMQKRSKLKRPLLRRFWPPTSSDDTNPYHTFRPREKDKYRLRRKRQNDAEAYRKLKQLRKDFDNLRAVVDLLKCREELQRSSTRLQVELFQQRLYDAIDTTGLPRTAKYAKPHEVKASLQTPTHFDVIKGGRAILQRTGGPVPESSSTTQKKIAPVESQEGQTSKANIAGINGGEPAPSFLHPMPSREGYVTSWDTISPHVTSYVNSHAEPTFRFRHRPRVGRGGRLCIDRLPQPMHTTLQPTTFLTAGRGMPFASSSKKSLLDLLPQPLDRKTISQTIHELSIAAIKEDFDAKQGDPDNNEAEEVMVHAEDWLETDDQVWGEERYSIGPL